MKTLKCLLVAGSFLCSLLWHSALLRMYGGYFFEDLKTVGPLRAVLHGFPVSSKTTFDIHLREGQWSKIYRGSIA